MSGIFVAIEIEEVWLTPEGELVLFEFSPFIDSWLVSFSDAKTNRITPHTLWLKQKDLMADGWEMLTITARQVLAA